MERFRPGVERMSHRELCVSGREIFKGDLRMTGVDAG